MILVLDVTPVMMYTNGHISTHMQQVEHIIVAV